MSNPVSIAQINTTAADANTGNASAGTQRVVLATDQPAIAVTPAANSAINVAQIGGNAVTAGAGAVAAGTQRTTLASDDPAVVSLAIIDDWDESDRAKVNVIVGQAGVTAGAGAVAANTPRMTLASDDPAVVSLAILDDWDESDRGKVNIIVGQAGVDAGRGASGATTQRVVPADKLYVASATITIAPENVATSATFVAGVESTVVSNISNLYDDVLVSGIWTAGTTPTANTFVNIYVYAPISDDLSSTVTYPDVLDGTSSAETFTSAGILASGVQLGASLSVDSNTSNRAYYCRPFSVAALFGGFLPTRWGLFISHNTGVNSNSTSGNHSWSYIGIKR